MVYKDLIIKATNLHLEYSSYKFMISDVSRNWQYSINYLLRVS